MHIHIYGHIAATRRQKQVRATSHKTPYYDPTYVHLLVGFRKATAAPFAKSLPFHFQQFPLFYMVFWNITCSQFYFVFGRISSLQTIERHAGVPAIQCQHIVNFIMCCEWVCVFGVRSFGNILYDVLAVNTCKLYAWPIST